MQQQDDQQWMERALELAELAACQGEVPVGAVLVHEGKVVAEGWNRPITNRDPTAHAEIIALRCGAERLGNYRLLGTTLYVTLEPCAMCVGAMVHARIERLVFGAYDPKSGAVISIASLADCAAFNHHFTWEGGVLEQESGALLQRFFQERRV